jgi:hypothetical protein
MRLWCEILSPRTPQDVPLYPHLHNKLLMLFVVCYCMTRDLRTPGQCIRSQKPSPRLTSRPFAEKAFGACAWGGPCAGPSSKNVELWRAIYNVMSMAYETLHVPNPFASTNFIL